MKQLFLTILCVFGFTGIAAAQTDTTQIQFDKNLNGYDYPFPVEHYEFHSQGEDLRMAYMYLPPKEAGKAVVTLLHGKNFNGAYWKETADYLQSLGYGVLMPDQVGFGKSTKEEEYQYSFAALANNTRMLMESLGIQKTILVGHSMGGMLAARFALLFPEQTEQLILVNPIGLENYQLYTQYKDVDFFYQKELELTPEKIIEYQKKNYYDGQWNDKYAALTLPLVGWVQGADWDDLAYVSARTYRMIFNQPVVEEFKDLKVPTTLIIGTRDRTAPGKGWMREGETRDLGRYDLLGAEIKQRNPAIDVIELQGLGHLPQIEDFERFKTAFNTALEKHQ